MVKLKAPLLSYDASGKLANAVTYATSRKRAYLKKHARPANPKTGKQLTVRAAMKFLSQQWKELKPINQATWAQLAQQKQISPYHAFIAFNQDRWNNFRGPSKEDPALEIDPTLTVRATVAIGGVGMVTLRLLQWPPYLAWGAAYFRKPTAAPPFGHDQCVLWMPGSGRTVTVYIDTPLDPGVYWYTARLFTVDGNLGPAYGPVTATVT